MCRKLIYLILFVLVLSPAGSAIAITIYDYQWRNDNNDGLWNKLVPTYNWVNNPGWQQPPVWTASGPPENVGGTNVSNNIAITGTPYRRIKNVTIPAGYDADCSNHADGYQTIFGPDWGLKLDIRGKLSVRWIIASAQGWEGLTDMNDPNDLVPPDDPNRSIVNMFDGSELYGPWLTGGTLGGNRCESVGIGLSWWMALPFVSWNMYGNSVVYTNSLHLGGHLNMYGGTFDVLNYVAMGTRDAFVVPDRLILIDIYEGKLILPNNYSNVVQDWINRGILLAYGTTPNVPGGGTIIINTEINPNRTTVTALPPNPLTATEPYPLDYATDVIRRLTLEWVPGRYAADTDGHELYFSSDFNDVNDRTVAPIILTNPYYIPPGLLEFMTTYYWAVDEVNDLHPDELWPGEVWRFTTRPASLIDDFERYVGTGFPATAGTLRETWIDGFWGVNPVVPTAGTSGSWVQLAADTSDGAKTWTYYNGENIYQNGAQAMKFYYDNTDDGYTAPNKNKVWWLRDLYGYGYQNWYPAPMYSEIRAAIDDAARMTSTPADTESLDLIRDWRGYKLLKLSFYGDPNNNQLASDKLFVGLADGNDITNPAVVTLSNSSGIKNNKWQDWYIPLQGANSFKAAKPSLNLANIARIHIGIGNRGTPTAGGQGHIFVDDIQLLADSICIPGSVVGDFDNDCTVNVSDLQLMTELWLGQMPTLPTPVINLDASGLSLGTLTTWNNSGSAGGSFKDFNSAVPGYRPKVKIVDGVKAVVFDGNDVMMATFRAPASITGNNPFTAIYKVWNPNIGIEEWVIMWAKRGTTARYAGVGYGTSPGWGVAAHWADPDMGFDRGVPAANTWHTIAVTYPGGPNTVETVLVDGVINATEGPKTLDIFADCNVTIGAAYDGNSTELKAVLTPMFNLSGAVSSVKIYGAYIAPKDLAILMDTPTDMKQDDVINFKDIAMLANKWLVGPVLFP